MISLRAGRDHLGYGTSVEAELVGDAVEDVAEESEAVRNLRTSHAQNQEGYEDFRFHFRSPEVFQTGRSREFFSGLHSFERTRDRLCLP
jgi:hypothetical protein